MLKRLLSIVLAISLVLGISGFSLANDEYTFDFILNNRNVSLENKSYVNEEGKIMVPLREVAEGMDYLVEWNGEDKVITVSKGFQVIKLKIDGSLVSVNDEKINMDIKPRVKDSKTFVPIEFFSRGLDLVVGLDNKHKVIQVNEPNENKEVFFNISKDIEKINELEAYMETLEKNQNFYGSILVSKDGEILLNKAYGFSDLQQNIENKSQTKFAIGSITKQFTAMGIMQLSEKGLINVEDKVSKYFPDLPNGELITIHNLLTHTSGLKNFTQVQEFLHLDENKKITTDMVNLVKDIPLEFQPGEEYRYSNTNYLLLGIVLEKVTGMSYEEYLYENIFEPLNMKNTGISYGKKSLTYDATAYSGFLEVVPVDDEILLSRAHGAGNIYSTVEDLYRWDQALKTEKLVKKETLDKIFTSHVTAPQLGDYGYGWVISSEDIGEKVWHDGNTLGFSSNISRYIDENLTIIVLTNKGYYNTFPLVSDLVSIVMEKDYEMPEALKEIEIDDPDLYNKYVGRYSVFQGVYIDIIEENNKLYAQVTDQGAFEIFPKSNSEFFAKLLDVRIKFNVKDDNNASELVLEQLGLKFVCPRVEEKEREIADIDSVIYNEYIGEYELAPDLIFTISTAEDKLYAQLTGQDAFEIFPMSENEYFYKDIVAKITFVKDHSGNVVELILNQYGQDTPAKKIK